MQDAVKIVHFTSSRGQISTGEEDDLESVAFLKLQCKAFSEVLICAESYSNCID